MGAWVETLEVHGLAYDLAVAPFVGAWVETMSARNVAIS